MAAPSSPLVLVTGASRGIGRAVAEAFAARGASVIGTSRHASPLGTGPAPEAGSVHLVHLDLEVPRTVDALFDVLEGQPRRLDVLVNNAGIGGFQLIEALSLSDWERVLAVNLTGAFLCARRALRLMVAGGGGRIVNLGSVADHTPFEACAAYCASKYGLRGLTGVITEEGKAHRVFATLVSPGAVATDIWRDRPGFDARDMLQPEAVARAIVDLAQLPLEIRVDSIELMPPRGIL